LLSRAIFVLLACELLWGSSAVAQEIRSSEVIDFNRDIRPLLSENCFQCHGFDPEQRQGNLRLDDRNAAIGMDGGSAAIVPHDPEASSLVERIYSTDEDLVMPPPSSHRNLTDAQKQLLVDWIKAGAPYDRHWAFSPLRAVPLPELIVKEQDASIDHQNTNSPKIAIERWRDNPIDRFVVKALSDRGLTPSPTTTPEKWLRRVSLDLLGIAPPPTEVDAFKEQVAQRGEAAYREAVNQLFASPHYGERMAQDWLDLARYADTHGFNNDTERSMWRWRDWVIDAFNKNMPYDQFITKQIAGDLLPNATLEDYLATGFCRNHVINSEGGIIDEEYRVEYVVDRVRTLGTGILGLTLECARCHDHKFDPLTQRDFYSLYAFFNQVDEVGEDGRDKNAFPLMLAPTPSQQLELAAIEQRIAAAEKAMQDVMQQQRVPVVDLLASPDLSAIASSLRPSGDPQPVVAPLLTRGPVRVEETLLGTALSLQSEESLIEWELADHANTPSKPWSFSTWIRWDGQAMPLLSSQNRNEDPSSSGFGRGLGIEIDAQGQLAVMLGARLPAYALHARSTDRLPTNEWSHLLVSYDGSGSAAGVMIAMNGSLAETQILADGFNSRDSLTNPLKVRLCSEHGPQRRWSKTPLAQPRWYTSVILVDSIIDTIDSQRMLQAQFEFANQNDLPESRQQALLAIQLRSTTGARASADYRAAWQEFEKAKRERQQLRQQMPTAMVMRERQQPRETFVLFRGQYNAPRDPVNADVPAALELPFPADAPRNRLGLAQWLTDPQHPLTARVAVNRLWMQFFGTGLVKTGEDFGYQGEFPSHPELLDWLALGLIESGWNIQHIQRQIVLSETYRQESRVSEGVVQVDPDNRLLARGPRIRLPAETLRDHLLNVGGLLRQRLGGPSVFPLQPDDLYQGIVVDAPYAGTKWGVSTGDDLYRRSIYTYWKRTVPYPVLNVFDAPDREFCVARRSITNTPLQALVLLNEPTLLEAARGLGKQMREHSTSASASDIQAGIVYGFRACTGRPPGESELAALQETMRVLESGFAGAPAEAALLAQNAADDTNVVDQATWIAIASILLNLDETITKN
jgi:hypothetical protein